MDCVADGAVCFWTVSPRTLSALDSPRQNIVLANAPEMETKSAYRTEPAPAAWGADAGWPMRYAPSIAN